MTWRAAHIVADLFTQQLGEADPVIDSLLDAESRSPAYCRKHPTEQTSGQRGGGITGLDVEAERAVRAGLIRIGGQA